MESRIHPIEHSYFEIRQIISDLIARYPFLSKKCIGRSVAGRDINAFYIGGGNDRVIFLGGDDPEYRITTLLILKFMEELCYCILKGKDLCGVNIRKALFGRELIFIPCLNPDGAEISLRGKAGCGNMAEKIEKLCKGRFDIWKSNLRGVEISKNFPLGFEERLALAKADGIDGPAPYGFTGYKEISEPETLALTELCRTKKIKHIIHLTGVGERVAYSATEKVLPHSEKMAEIIAAVSGYTITPPIGMSDTYIADWFCSEFFSPAISLKIGKEKIPNVKEVYKEYSKLKEALTLSAVF